HLRPPPPTRPRGRDVAHPGVGRRGRTGRRRHDHRPGLHRVPGARLPQQGAAYGYTHRLGYHPLLATRADSGEVLHARQRTGRANTARGTARFVDELAARVRRAGATGELTMRADSGFWSAKTIRACRRHQLRYSITVRP